jgi:hypothetical protein
MGIPWDSLWPFLAGTTLVVVALLGWAANFVGLPGNWVMVGVAIPAAYLLPESSRVDLGWTAIAALVVLALTGELLEFLAGALGVQQAGGSRRSAVMAMIGSIVGGALGLMAGIPFPIPVVGSLVAAVLFASLGALVGALLGEDWKGRDFDQAVRVGHAAFWGRMLGTVAKVAVGAVMCAIVVIGVFV